MVVNMLLGLLLPFWAMALIKREQIRVIVTVAAGNFFLTAALVSWITSKPLVLIVHDDWVASMRGSTRVLKYFCSDLFRLVAKNSSYVYAVSPPMQKWLREAYGVESGLQMPAAEYSPESFQAERQRTENRLDSVRIVYAGTGAGNDSFDLMIRLLQSDKLRTYQLRSWEMHVYMQLPEGFIEEKGWVDDSVIFHGWVPQDRLRTEIAKADILYLPYSFESQWKALVSTSFPAKTADYLRSGKSILICAPEYSSVVEYASLHGFAELVTNADLDALAHGVARICESRSYRLALLENAQKVFNLNHNIDMQRREFVETVERLSHSWSAIPKGR